MTQPRTATESRADRFVREVAELRIPDPAAGRATTWLRLGVALLVLGPVLEVVAYLLAHGTGDALVQRDAIVLAVGGLTSAAVGAALFLRYSLTGFLRFWMARQSHDLAVLGDRLVDASSDPRFGREVRDGLAPTDPAAR